MKILDKLDCFLELEFLKLKFRPKIEFFKVDLCLILILKRKKKVELKFSKLELHLKKITVLVFPTLEFTKLEFHLFFFFFFFYKSRSGVNRI